MVPLITTESTSPSPMSKKTQTKEWRGEKFTYFSRAELWAQDRALREGSTALLVYHALCRLEFEAPSKYKNAFLASAKDIAAVTGIGARTVVRRLGDLQRCGVISIQSGKKPKGGHEKNRITLVAIPHAPPKRASVALRHCDVTPPVPASVAHNSNSHLPTGEVTNNDSGAFTPPCADGTAGEAPKKNEKTEKFNPCVWE